ncbi:9357_t:CDS:2 [Funneliformis mosseae]|uniref:9357_t:CDS:1 n=1 Tax=Funneliformis mosseae TaxID=27381 RepID=A0A9N9FNY0_FUNMO|nr:9357_t:CDS:2 [Funneliformis mosseae]
MERRSIKDKPYLDFRQGIYQIHYQQQYLNEKYRDIICNIAWSYHIDDQVQSSNGVKNSFSDLTNALVEMWSTELKQRQLHAEESVGLCYS